MFWKLLSIENTKIFKRKMLWIELGLLGFLTAGMFLMLFTAGMFTGSEELSDAMVDSLLKALVWPGGLMQSLGMAAGNGLGGLMLVILVGAITAQEYTWRTMQLWLSRGVARPALMAAKFAALLLPAVLIVLVPLFFGGIVTGIFSLILDGSLHAEQINFGQLFLAALRTAYTLLPYGALAFLLAIATRSTAAAIGGGVAYALLLEGIVVQILTLIGGTLGKLLAYVPTNLATALLALNEGALNSSVNVNGNPIGQIELLDPLPAALGIAIWTIAFVATALLIFRRQDLSE